MTTRTTGVTAGPAPTAEQIRQAHSEKLDAIARYRRGPREVAGDGSTEQPTSAAASETRR